MQAADFKALLAQRQLPLPVKVQENAASYLLGGCVEKTTEGSMLRGCELFSKQRDVRLTKGSGCFTGFDSGEIKTNGKDYWY